MNKILYVGLIAAIFTRSYIHAMEEEPASKRKKLVGGTHATQPVETPQVFVQCSDGLVEIDQKLVRWSKTIENMLTKDALHDGAYRIALMELSSKQLKAVMSLVRKLTKNDKHALNKKPIDVEIIKILKTTDDLLTPQLIGALKHLDLLGSPCIKAVFSARIDAAKNHMIPNTIHKQLIPAITRYACHVDEEFKKDAALLSLYQEMIEQTNQPIEHGTPLWRACIHEVRNSPLPCRVGKYRAELIWNEGKIKIFDVMHNQLIKEIVPTDKYNFSPHSSVLIDRTGTQLAIFDPTAKTLSVLDVETNNIIRQHPDSRFWVLLAWSPDNEWIRVLESQEGITWGGGILNVQTGDYTPYIGTTYDEWITDRYILNIFPFELFDLVKKTTRQLIRQQGTAPLQGVRLSERYNKRFIAQFIKDSGQYLDVWSVDAPEQIEAYFNEKMSLAELSLVKKIGQAKMENKKYALAPCETAILNALSQDNPVVGKMMQEVLQRYVA